MAAPWTEVCLAYPALSAIDDGYEVYAVAGAIPMTLQQVMYGWQRDWARVKTADLVRDVVRQHAGAFGQGVIYAKAMFGAEEGKPLAQPAAASRV